MISKSEQEHRRKIVEYGMATCELEGCVYSKEQKALYKRYINGELSLKELGAIVRKNLSRV